MALVLHRVEQGDDDGGNFVIVDRPGKPPTLESFSGDAWDWAKDQLLNTGKITASEAEGLH